MSRKKPGGNGFKEEGVKFAMKMADDFQVALDFSHESIKTVDKVLGEFQKDYKKKKSDEGLMGIAIAFAAYIVSVIERNSTPGDWKRNDPTFGEDTFPFEWQGYTIFPVGWCMKRIIDGKPDDIWFRYKTFVLEKRGPDNC